MIKVGGFTKIFISWLPLAIVTTACIGTAYVLAQQINRQTANDPQIQIANDASGVAENTFMNAKKANLEDSLDVFTIIYDKNLTPTFSSALLNGQIPTIPSGVFAEAAKRGENRITWQPQEGVREAIVVRPIQNGYIVVGRSLREVEKRSDDLLKLAAVAELITLIATFFMLTFKHLILNRGGE